MHLYLMRHGPAEDESPSGRDQDRVLSEEGKEVVRTIVTQWRADAADKLLQRKAPHRIFTSPYPRAKETAAMVGAAFNLQVEEDGTLALDDDALSLVRRLEREEVSHAILVGHEPDLSRLYFNLTGDGTTFQRGTVVALTATRNETGMRYTLEWRLNGS